MYAAGKRAKGECDVCGLTYRLGQLKALRLSGRDTAVRACPTCWNPEHPQDQIRPLPIDAQALQNARPDPRPADMFNIWWGWNPIYGVEARGEIGQVTVVV